MQHRIAAIVLLSVFFCFPAAPPADADSDSRPATDAEMSFYRRVFNALADAVPAKAPQGWQVVERTAFESLEAVSVGAENEPFWVSYTIVWNNAAAIQEAEARLAAEGTRVMAQQGDDAALAADTSRLEQLAEAAGEAAVRGDKATAQRLEKEMQALAQTLESRYAQRDKELEDAMVCLEPRDARAEITLMANVLVESFMAPFAVTEPVGGHPVYRTEGDRDPDYGWQEGASFVFLGNGWQLNGEGDEAFMEFLAPSGQPHIRVQTVLVRVQAEEQRARNLLKRIDWKALEGLIGT